MREFETERLCLRAIRHSDAQRIFDCWAHDGRVTKYLTWEPHESVEVTERIVEMWVSAYEKSDTYRWGMERKEDGTLIGMIDVVGFRDGCPMIGYCSGTEYWNRGYMTEALRGVVGQLFAAGFERIRIEAAVENIGSNRVIEKAGFVFTGRREAVGNERKPWIREINSYEIRK